MKDAIIHGVIGIALFLLTYFAFLTVYVLRKRKKEARRVKALTEAKPQSPELGTVPFTDLPEYLESLKTDGGEEFHRIAIGSMLIEAAQKALMPFRLKFTMELKYDDRGDFVENSTCLLSTYEHKGWKLVKTLPVGMKHSTAIVEEVINSLSQLGYSCMNDTVSQLTSHIFVTSEANRVYLSRRCLATDSEGTLRAELAVIVNFSSKYPELGTQVFSRMGVRMNKEPFNNSLLTIQMENHHKQKVTA